KAVVELDEQRRGARACRAPSECGKPSIGVSCCRQGEPRDLEPQPWIVLSETGEATGRKRAELHRGHAHDAVIHRRLEDAFKPDDVTGQEEVQNLPSAAVDQRIAKGPAAEQRVEMAVWHARNDIAAGCETQMTGLIVLNCR